MKNININDFVNKIVNIKAEQGRRFNFNLSEELLRLNIRRFHVKVMDIISANKNKLKISEIAEQTSISLPLMTHVIDQMEESKLLKRIRSENDRRVVEIDLTDRGKKILSKFQLQQKKQIVVFLKSLNKKDRDVYVESSNAIHEILKKNGHKKKKQ